MIKKDVKRCKTPFVVILHCFKFNNMFFFGVVQFFHPKKQNYFIK